MTVPMLDEMIQLSAANGAREVVIGMAHRGRLNVLAHNLGRAYETIWREFEGASSIEAVTTIPQGGTGDVKYHHGAQGTYQLPDDSSVIVRLESNPSHLEFVSPVVEGATRAVQTTRQGPHAHIDNNAAMPIILHGDAAFPAQGVVAETFNLQALDGYQVGGTLHLIQNNQVGFTTDPEEARSTRWASDLAKGFDVPIIHVNADDVAACISAVRLGFAFRQEFGHDIVIDLIGYRRFGHNEADEPAYTQPEMAARIKEKVPVREIFAAAARRPRRALAGRDRRDPEGDLGRDGGAPPRAQGGALARAGRAAHGRLPARPLAVAGGQDGRLGRAPARPQRGPAAVPRWLQRPPEADQAAREAPRRGRARRRHRLGARRGARVRLAAQRGHAGAAHRPGLRARHVLAAPSRPARRQDRPARIADPAAAGRARADGAAQLAAVRDRLPGLRVRLLDGGARDARAVGGPVRRLRQLGAGDRRPVHHQRARQVGPDHAPDAAAPARLRGLRPRALLGAARALPHARRRGQHARRRT